MNANRLMMLIDTSTKGTGSIMNAPRKATGKPMMTQVAIFMCRKMPRMANTSTAPSAMFSSIMLRRPLR